MRLTLTLEEINVILDSLHAHFAGDVSIGDLSWSEKEAEAAERVLDKLIAAASGTKKGTRT